MNKIYFIQDKTDANFRKPFVAICKTLKGAEAKMLSMQSKLNEKLKGLISMDSLDVTDFDGNKSSVYVIYDKTDKNHPKPVVAAYFDYSNASNALNTLRAKVSPHAQKLIYLGNEQLS